MITKQQLLTILPSAAKPDNYLPCLEQAMIDGEINTSLRIAMFLAQTGHESGSFHYLEELASGAAYEGRKDLGNIQPGDGVRFKGRGVIQITGRNNYKAYSDYTGIDFISSPTDLIQPIYAFGSAAWFWKIHNLNKFSDMGDLKGATKVINGGYNGLADRQAIYDRAKKALGI